MVSNDYFLKYLCKVLRRTGIGEFWYDGQPETGRYIIFQVLLFILFYLMTLSEFLEIILNTLPRDLHADTASLGFSYVVILARFHALHYKKTKIKQLNLEVVEYDENDAKDTEIEKIKYKRIKLSFFVQVFVVYSGVSFYLVEGLRRYFDKQPFVILPSFWPYYEDHSAGGIAAKILMYLCCAWILAAMISADTLAVTHLIMMYYRFMYLGNYFLSLDKDFRNSSMSSKELKMRCMHGLFKHRELLRFSKRLMDCFGLMMSLEVLQGSIILVLVLFRTLLSSDKTLPALVMNFFFALALLIQLALYMWNAGEVTYQASQMSTSIFHCGWHRRSIKGKDGKDIRRLILMGCAQAQRPVIMMAFGVQELSYRAFVSVVRATYSLVAVLTRT